MNLKMLKSLIKWKYPFRYKSRYMYFFWHENQSVTDAESNVLAKHLKAGVDLDILPPGKIGGV